MNAIRSFTGAPGKCQQQILARCPEWSQGPRSEGCHDYLADGLSGFRQAIETAFPEAEYQRCTVHQVRNTLKYVSYKDRKPYATDLKRIYPAPDADIAHEELLAVQEKWEEKYPRSVQSWVDNWDLITPIFKFFAPVRKIIYTTNAIESLNSTYKKLNHQRSLFPSAQSLLKTLYLSTLQATKRWTQLLRNWGQAYGEFLIMYGDRMA